MENRDWDPSAKAQRLAYYAVNETIEPEEFARVLKEMSGKDLIRASLQALVVLQLFDIYFESRDLLHKGLGMDRNDALWETWGGCMGKGEGLDDLQSLLDAFLRDGINEDYWRWDIKSFGHPPAFKVFLGSEHLGTDHAAVRDSGQFVLFERKNARG